MDQLMSQDPLGLLVDHRKGQDDPVFKPFRDPTGGNTDVPHDRIGLLKFGVIVIKNEGIPSVDLFP
jgi:hypothetical protein